ncbi:MAG: lipid-A-disaccharide synthase N-terminal domain-containing protein [Terrimicrobiaceae bacterium]|nr:lipid-A-disaccharide synthase N-terminal domain-containing protein [Terrimicrobiaceae bacterium]
MDGQRDITPVRMRFVCIFFLILGFTRASADTLDTLGRPAKETATTGHVAEFKIDLPDAKNTVAVVQLPDGSLAYRITRPGRLSDRVLTPEEFTRYFYLNRRGGGWLATIFNVTSPAGLAWVALGLGGQLLFTGRMLVQWLTSERERRSVIPVAFWWMSLIGATMLLVYFIWRRDIVGVLGQATGWIIYIRNLMLIRSSGGG